MIRPGGSSVVGYNVQTAVDEKHHLIAVHEVTNATTDKQQLEKMAKKAKKELKVKTLTVVADAGYYKSKDIRGCQNRGITVLFPKPSTSNNKAAGLYDKKDFRYDAKADQYRCPAGETLPRRHSSKDKGKKMHYYYASQPTCRACHLKPQCTTGKTRRVSRWKHEAALEKAEAELQKHPSSMRQRKALVEHPFGTLKYAMGATHFLTKRLPSVKAEMSLHILAYNMKRAINVLGAEKIIKALQPA